EPIGWWGILLGFVIITYYPVILAWCGSYLIECVKGIFNGGILPWAGEGMEGVKKAGEFFERSYLNMWTSAELDAGTKPWSLGGLVGPITVSLAVVWILLYLCIFRGVRMVSKVVMWTVPLPWIMLLILTIRGLTLSGATEGLNFYLAPDWAMLAKPETWRWAFGQMFFSMSLAFGVMVTYASFLHRKSDINNNATIIGLADVGTSFVAGIAVFATLGAMAFATAQAGLPVTVEKVVSGGPGLAFVAFPYALAQLPASAWFGTVFFIALLTLGIDSAFSITESVLASLIDKTGWNRQLTLIGMTFVGFACGLVYCTRGGLAWLGGIDDFINSSWGGIALLGLLECVVVGWAYRVARLRQHANERSDWQLGAWWDLLIRYLAPIILSTLFVWSLLEKFSTTSGFLFTDAGDLNVPIFVGLIIAIAVPVISVILSLIRSPGANRHAQHVGQSRSGRAVGILGMLLVLLTIGCVVYAFGLVKEAHLVSPEVTPESDAAVSDQQQLTAKARTVLMVSLAAGILGTALGAGVVAFSEKNTRRPSGFARLAAGLGVMGIGASAGVLLSIHVLLHPVETAAKAAHQSAEELSSASYVILAIMLGLLVVGLGWCFYRAIKAAGAAGPETPQLAENGENS
ncbi:MAG: SLC5/6 family protein, partial [Planctomycetota bacterium]